MTHSDSYHNSRVVKASNSKKIKLLLTKYVAYDFSVRCNLSESSAAFVSSNRRGSIKS